MIASRRSLLVALAAVLGACVMAYAMSSSLLEAYDSRRGIVDEATATVSTEDVDVTNAVFNLTNQPGGPLPSDGISHLSAEDLSDRSFRYDGNLTLVKTSPEFMDFEAFRLRRCRNGCEHGWDVDEKYYVMQPYRIALGGMGNQKILFNVYGVFSRHLNRTLLVPPFCTHMFTTCMRADFLWDFPYFNSFHDVRALPQEEYNIERYMTPDVFVRVVHRKIPGDDFMFMDLFNKSLEGLREEFFGKLRDAHKNKPFMQYANFPIYWYQPFRYRLRMSPTIRTLAASLRRKAFSHDGARRLLCFQVRWGDRLKLFWGNNKMASLQAFIALARENEKISLRETEAYFATEGLEPEHLTFLESNFFKVHVARNVFPALTNGSFLGNFAPGTAHPDLVNDFLGAVEALLCTCADRFIGTDVSTFSYMTQDFRYNLREMFPECDEWFRTVRGMIPTPETMPSHLVRVNYSVIPGSWD